MNADKANMCVLVVEDDDDLRESVIFMLKLKGYRILEAANGTQAIELVKNNHVDIVFSDIMMPNGNGIEMLKKIREINPKIPVVVLVTGFSDITEAQAKELGAFALLDKPLSSKKLYDYMEKASQLKMAAA